MLQLRVKHDVSHQTSKRRWWRFSLKTLLVLLTLFCVWLGTLANSANRQKRAVEAIQQSGGEFNYDYQRSPSRTGRGQSFSLRVEPPGPTWLRRILGDHYFITPVAMRMSETIIDDCLLHLAALPAIESASFGSVTFRNQDFDHLAMLTNLRSLAFHKCTFREPQSFDALAELRNLETFSLQDPNFGDDDVKHLSGAANLSQLFLYETAITDEGVAHFQKLHRLKMLSLSRTKVGDLAMIYLSKLPELEYLSVGDTQVSDAAIESFLKIPALKEIELHDTRMTSDGINRLRPLLPNCMINGQGGPGLDKQFPW
jgi:hypothetical protein